MDFIGESNDSHAEEEHAARGVDCLTRQDSANHAASWAATVFVALLLAVSICFGVALSSTGGVEYLNLSFARNLLLAWIACIALLSMGRQAIDRCRANVKPAYGCIMDGRYGMLRLILATFIPHLIVLLAAWPGYFFYDANWQFSMMEPGGMAFTTHHPVLHTLILNGFVRGGAALFGSWNKGIALFLGSQALFLSWVYAMVVREESRLGASRVMQWVTVMYFAVSPLIAMFSVCSTKDVLFSAATMLLAMHLGKMLSVSPMRPAKTDALYLAALVFLTCALRNNALPALALVVVTILFLVNTNRKVIVRSFAVGICLYLVWTAPIVKAFGVQSGPSHEAYSLPGQMMARAYHTDRGLSQENRDAIAAAIPSVADYCPTNADAVKESMKGDLNDLKLWLKVGFESPKAYVDALMRNTQAAWDLGNSKITGYIDSGTIKGRETCLFGMGAQAPGHHESKLPILADYLRSVAYDGILEDIPIIGLLVRVSFMNWVAVIGLWYGLVVHDQRLLGVSLVVVAVGVSSLFAPLVLARYYLLSFMAFPLIVELLLTGGKSTSLASEVASA